MTNEELEVFLKDKAKRGWSRTMCYGYLGISSASFASLTENMNIEWPRAGQSVCEKRAAESKRGNYTEGLKRSVAAAQEARRRPAKIYTIGVHSGTVVHLYAIWGGLSSLSKDGIKQRLKRGWNLLDAFFLPSHTGSSRHGH